ncbi:hypothetical protein CLF_100109, partial [Clonorchis sinensis]
MRWILVLTTLFIAYEIRAYVKMDYPDYCFYDAMRFDEDTGFYIFLNPVKRDRTASSLFHTPVYPYLFHLKKAFVRFFVVIVNSRLSSNSEEKHPNQNLIKTFAAPKMSKPIKRKQKTSIFTLKAQKADQYRLVAIFPVDYVIRTDDFQEKYETDTLSQFPVDEEPYKLKKLMNMSGNQSENVPKTSHDQLRLTMEKWFSKFNDQGKLTTCVYSTTQLSVKSTKKNWSNDSTTVGQCMTTAVKRRNNQDWRSVVKSGWKACNGASVGVHTQTWNVRCCMNTVN